MHKQEATGRPRVRWGDLLAMLLLAAVVLGAPLFVYSQMSAASAASPGEIRLVAERYEDGGWQPSRIRVKAGEKVRLVLTSQDVTHGFLIPDLGLESGPIVAGQEKVLEFVAPGPGVYSFYCHVLCSHRHGAMVGKLVVE